MYRDAEYVYIGEKQLLKGCRKMAEAAESNQLGKAGKPPNLAETQIERLEKVFEICGVRPRAGQ